VFVPFSQVKAEKNISSKNIFKYSAAQAKLTVLHCENYVYTLSITLQFCLRFVFMALMEYCLVNIVLGDSDGPKRPPENQKPDKVFDLAARVSSDVLFI